MSYETVWLIRGKHKYLVDCNSVDLAKETATQCGIDFDDIQPSVLSRGNGIFKAWGIGYLADHLQRDKAASPKGTRGVVSAAHPSGCPPRGGGALSRSVKGLHDV